jgi:hypothetical protein
MAAKRCRVKFLPHANDFLVPFYYPTYYFLFRTISELQEQKRVKIQQKVTTKRYSSSCSPPPKLFTLCEKRFFLTKDNHLKKNLCN